MTKKYTKHLKKLAKVGKYDCWNFDMEMAYFALPRLKYIRKAEGFTPSGFEIWEGIEEWNGILDKMILAFKLIKKGDYMGYGYDNTKIIREGLDLFAEYLPALWT